MIRPIDPDELRRHVRSATPFPFFSIDNFLDPDFARQVDEAFPSYQDACQLGRVFKTVNEKRKVQITDRASFAAPVRQLSDMLASPDWLRLLSYAFEIPNLLADDELLGGGIHETGSRGRLDVHVDFNYVADRKLFRRLNALVFFNRDWKPEWGGRLELWDPHVKVCRHAFSPDFNRCVVFQTDALSYHGVTAVRCPEDRARKSFAAYYYTQEAPADWPGTILSTAFRSRPGEVLRGHVLMPAERTAREIRQAMWTLRRGVKKIIKRR